MAAVCTAALLAGCATAAQVQYRHTGDIFKSAAASLKTCIAAVLAKPDYAVLAPHTNDMLNEKEFTTAQRADDTRPSLEEARLLGLGEDELADCRNQFEKTTIEQIPGLVPVFEQAETAARAITLLAAQRKITWGEYASRLSAAHSAYKILAAAAVQQYEGQLTAQHQAELQNRRAAAAILLQYGLQLQELDNQRRAIDSTNRPVFTNCTAGGPMTVNCVSH